MFADIKDSTHLIRDLDPEAAQQLLDPAIHIMMDAVHRFEGTVNQVLGDGIMAIFGAPVAHEDHALRACYAALAMQAAPQRRQRTLDGLKRLLLRESQVQPLLLVFEDLHWIDSETQALLDSLIDSLPTAQLLLLVNYRPEYQHSWGSKTYYTQLRLDPLPPEGAEVLLHALLGDDPSLDPLKKLLIERTEGNPFFLEESVRTLLETQALDGDPGDYRLTRDLPSSQVPPTVQAVLAARIDRLPQEEKRLLQIASVIGPEVSFPLLQAIAERSEDVLHGALTHLQGAEFLYETRLYPEREYTFKHALTQNVAYQSLLTQTRQQVHGRIAQTLEGQFSEVVSTQPELLAHHYSEADLAERAIPIWHRAGDLATQRAANQEAIEHFSHALELLNTLPQTPERDRHALTLYVAVAERLELTKGLASSEVERAWRQADERCQRMQEPPFLDQILAGLFTVYFSRGAFLGAQELGERLHSHAQRQNTPFQLLRAYWLLGQALFQSGKLVQSRARLAQAIALYELRINPKQQHYDAMFYDMASRCLTFAALQLWHLGYVDQALASSQAGLTLAQELSRPYCLARALAGIAMIHQHRHEVQALCQYAEAAMVISREHAFPEMTARSELFRGWALAMQGQGTEVIADMHRSLEQNGPVQLGAFRPYFLTLLADAYGALQQPESGLAVVGEALAQVNATGQRLDEANLYRLKGDLLLQLSPDNQTEAATCFHQALDIARRQQAKSLELRAATSLARLWQSQGKRQEAYELLEPVYGWFTEGFDTADLKDAKTLLGELGGSR